MAARAYVKWFNQAGYDSMSEKDLISFEITFCDANIAGGYEVAYGEVQFTPGDPASQLRGAITTVIQAEAGARGFSVAKQDMCIPAVQQGV